MMEPVIFIISTTTILWLFVRVVEVSKFKKELKYKCHSICNKYIDSLPDNTTYEDEVHYDELNAIRRSINDIPFIEMVLSFKPLTEKHWLNDIQQEFIEMYEHR